VSGTTGDERRSSGEARLRGGVLTARVIASCVVVAAAFAGGERLQSLPVIVVAATAAVSAAVYAWAERREIGGLAAVRSQLLLDVVFVTLLARYSGGLESPFTLLYYLPVVAAAQRLRRRDVTTLAFASLGGYLVLAFVGFEGWITLWGSGALAEMGVLALSLMLVAALASFLSSRARESERKLDEARSALDVAELRLSSVAGSMRSGLAIVDSDGRVAYLNPAGEQILALRRGEIVGHPHEEVLAHAPIMSERIASALRSGEPESRVELTVERGGGAAVPVGLSTSILEDEGGSGKGVVAVFQDLTDVRRHEEEKRHADRLAAIGEFAAGVAHEIRNPLNAIRGSVELLRDIRGPVADDEAKLYGLVIRESDRLSNLVRDILHYGRPDRGSRSRVDLIPLVSEVAAIVRHHPSLVEGIEVETAGSAGSIEADPEQIKQAVLNLAVNAVEAIEDGGRVTIMAVAGTEFAERDIEGDPAREVAVVVEDTGCGIDGDAVADLTKPFATTKKGGTGLGLAIVDRIVQSHGGRIEVRGERGVGTRFVLYFPTDAKQ